MDTLLVYNLSSVLSAIGALLSWSKHNYQFKWLIYYLSFSLIFCIIFHSIFLSRGRSHLKRTVIYISINLFMSIAVFLVIIFLLGASTGSLASILNHSIVLALLTSYPKGYLRYDLLLTGKDIRNNPTVEDKFALINLIAVVAISWFASLSSYHDSKSETVIYPVASCLGAIISFLVTNLCGVLYYLFQHYNTLWVY